MIAKIKSKKAVVIDTFKGVIATPQCEIITWTHGDNSEDRANELFAANGQYFYEKVTTKKVEKMVEGQLVLEDVETIEKVIIQIDGKDSFYRELTASAADQLFPMLNIQYPENATYSQKKRIEVLAGLKYIVASEKYWGLKGSDWEII